VARLAILGQATTLGSTCYGVARGGSERAGRSVQSL